MNYYFYPLRDWSKKNKKLKESSKRKNSLDIGFLKFYRLLKTFEVKNMHVNIDTGDCILNAKLYPVFAFLNYHVGGFQVNFEGKNRLAMHVENRPIRIIKTFINF